MFLEHLYVHANGILKREINFKRGLNLIIDEPVSTGQDSGNSIGKTTALRAIDFCFGAKPEIFYQDKEFKNNNKIVKDFFESNSVIFTLVLAENKRRLTLVRNVCLNANEKPIFQINDQQLGSLQRYTKELKYELFRSISEKPTFRQISSRFIRSDNKRMTNALKTLHDSTSNIEYETLNLFLFGYGNPELLSDKQQLKKQKTKQEKILRAIKQEIKVGALKQSLVVIDEDIENKEAEKANFSLASAYIDETNRLEKLKEKISELSIKVSQLETRKMLTMSSINKLRKSREDIDIQDVESIYKEAEARIGNLPRTFEESINFYNQMIDRKVDFMSKEIPKLESTIEELIEEREALLDKESSILSEISNTGSLADLQVLQGRLNELYENRGKTLQAIEQIEEAENKLNTVNQEIAKIDSKLSQQQARFEKQLQIFNRYFSRFTEVLYGEEYVLFTETKKDHTEFLITPVKQISSSENPGEGTKKSLVTAFDFAYQSYVGELKGQSIKFVAHDGIESIHHNQVNALFNIAQSLGSQYVVATLRKTVEHMGKEFIDQNTVLSLSKTKKFFEIEKSVQKPQTKKNSMKKQ